MFPSFPASALLLPPPPLPFGCTRWTFVTCSPLNFHAAVLRLPTAGRLTCSPSIWSLCDLQPRSNLCPRYTTIPPPSLAAGSLSPHESSWPVTAHHLLIGVRSPHHPPPFIGALSLLITVVVTPLAVVRSPRCSSPSVDHPSLPSSCSICSLIVNRSQLLDRRRLSAHWITTQTRIGHSLLTLWRLPHMWPSLTPHSLLRFHAPPFAIDLALSQVSSFSGFDSLVSVTLSTQRPCSHRSLTAHG